MGRIGKSVLVGCFLMFISLPAHAASDKHFKQLGIGLGTVSPYPVTSFPYALMAAIEGTYRWNVVGLSIVGTLTSSPHQADGYRFAPESGGIQQTFLEPRLYMSILHAGFSIGFKLSQNSSGTIEGVLSYGPMLGFEIPFGRVSLGVDGRYLLVSNSNPAPLSTVMMIRFKF